MCRTGVVKFQRVNRQTVIQEQPVIGSAEECNLEAIGKNAEPSNELFALLCKDSRPRGGRVPLAKLVAGIPFHFQRRAIADDCIQLLER
jgi:hypothetical protein